MLDEEQTESKVGYIIFSRCVNDESYIDNSKSFKRSKFEKEVNGSDSLDSDRGFPE